MQNKPIPKPNIRNLSKTQQQHIQNNHTAITPKSQTPSNNQHQSQQTNQNRQTKTTSSKPSKVTTHAITINKNPPQNKESQYYNTISTTIKSKHNNTQTTLKQTPNIKYIQTNQAK